MYLLLQTNFWTLSAYVTRAEKELSSILFMFWPMQEKKLRMIKTRRKFTSILAYLPLFSPIWGIIFAIRTKGGKRESEKVIIKNSHRKKSFHSCVYLSLSRFSRDSETSMMCVNILRGKRSASFYFESSGRITRFKFLLSAFFSHRVESCRQSRNEAFLFWMEKGSCFQVVAILLFFLSLALSLQPDATGSGNCVKTYFPFFLLSAVSIVSSSFPPKDDIAFAVVPWETNPALCCTGPSFTRRTIFAHSLDGVPIFSFFFLCMRIKNQLLFRHCWRRFHSECRSSSKCGSGTIEIM